MAISPSAVAPLANLPGGVAGSDILVPPFSSVAARCSSRAAAGFLGTTSGSSDGPRAFLGVLLTAPAVFLLGVTINFKLTHVWKKAEAKSSLSLRHLLKPARSSKRNEQQRRSGHDLRPILQGHPPPCDRRPQLRLLNHKQRFSRLTPPTDADR